MPPEVIDVEEYFKRFEDPEGFVQLSSAEEFRKAWRGQSRSQGQHSTSRSSTASTKASTQSVRARDKPTNNRRISSGHLRLPQATPSGRSTSVSVPRPNSSSHPTKRPRVDPALTGPSSSNSVKKRSQARPAKNATSSFVVDLTITPPEKQRRKRSPPPSPSRSPSVSAMVIPSSPDFMIVDDQSYGDNFRNDPSPDDDDDFYEPPPSPLWRKSPSMTPATTSTARTPSRSTTLKRSRSPSTILKTGYEPDELQRGFAPPLERSVKKETVRGKSVTTFRVKSETVDFKELEEVEKMVSEEPPTKKRKYHPPLLPRRSTLVELSSGSEHDVATTDDDDDDWHHPGLDLNDPDAWLPIPRKTNKLDIMQDFNSEERGKRTSQSIVSKVKTLSISTHPYKKRGFPNTWRWMITPPLPRPGPPVYIWEKLRLAENLRIRPRPKPLGYPNMVFLRSKDIDFNLHRLKVAHSFKEAPGTINVIEQKGGLSVFGSACIGGHADVPDETPSPYNRPGSLIVRDDGKLHVLDKHKITRRGLPERVKYYTINDTKFDPTSNSFASSGEDKRVRIWIQSEHPDTGENIWEVDLSYDYDQAPHTLAYRPKSSILAVAEKAVHVYNFHEEYVLGHTFVLHNVKKYPHRVGSIAWGSESTAEHLFVSSEPKSMMRTFSGVHKVFDLQSNKEAYQLDAEEAGDNIAVDLEGSMLALCTQAEQNKHILRLYDIRRREPTARVSLIITPFTRGDGGDNNFEGEVNVMAFSPEGLYLALARNDNHTHLYDRRMIRSRQDGHSEPLFDYEHKGESKAVSEHELYGIVNAQWIQSSLTRSTCLVTGGEDGCVRLWDPSRAVGNADNGKVIAEVNYDISQFSVGDPFAGEHRLIVGDASGRVTIFDNICV